MCRITIITPIYHGKRYIPSLIRQAEDCAQYMKDKIDIELLLVNDAPDESLNESYCSKYIQITVLDTDINRGIHGARVRGLENCAGEYVLFLDQDDKIAPAYIQSQLKHMGMADAVVCRCIHENKPYYNADRPFENMMCKEYMLADGCPIISPGQVLLRRESVPRVWTENIMRNNCADDFFLWLCMAGCAKTFALNEEILFEHVVRYDNTSWNSLRMMDSEAEMVELLKKNHVFTGDDIEGLNHMLMKIKKKHMDNLDKFRRMFYILNDWTTLRESGKRIVPYLKRQNIHSIAIYGIGYLGKHLLQEVEKDGGLEIRYLIDRNAEWIHEAYPVRTMEDQLDKVDGVIVTLVQGEGRVVDQVKEKTGAVVYTIRELVCLVEEEEDI